MTRLISAAILSFFLLSASGSTANAQFNYDFGSSGVDLFEPLGPQYTLIPEYEVWGTNPKPQWIYDLILVFEDGSEEVFGSYYSKNDADRWLLLGWDYMLFDTEALVSSRVEVRNGRRPTLLDTFDSRDDAEALEVFARAFGWDPYIVTRYRVIRRW